MDSDGGILKASEAAVIADVPLRDVHRMIDERILPDRLVLRANGRRTFATACPLISFYVATAETLTAKIRGRMVRQLGEELARKPCPGEMAAYAEIDLTLRHDFLIVDVSAFVVRAGEQLLKLADAQAAVVSTPEILGGAPVFRGTRVPVHDVASLIAAGNTVDEVLVAYPALTAELVRRGCHYARANPLRGRPIVARRPAGALAIVDRRISRSPVG